MHNFQTLCGVVGSARAKHGGKNGLLVEQLAHHVVVVLEQAPEADHLLCVLIRDLLVDQGANLPRKRAVFSRESGITYNQPTYHIVIQGHIVGQYNVQLDNLVELLNLGINSLPLAVRPAQIVIVVLGQLNRKKLLP